MVSLVEPVQVERRSVTQLQPIIGAQRDERLVQVADQFRQHLGGRTIWNISSTATGGGVAEMLHVLLGYAEDLGIPVQWRAITGDAEFFVITKRIHNQIHGETAGVALTDDDADHFARMPAAHAALLLNPQTSGMTGALVVAVAGVAWRCHIGVDWQNNATRGAWEFLRPELEAAHGFVFTRREYVPDWIPADKVAIIPPSIDPLAPKNEPLDTDTVRGILGRIGVLDGATPDDRTSFERSDGSVGFVTRYAEVTGEGRPGPTDPVVVPVGSAQGHAGRHARVRGICRARRRRLPVAGRPGGRRGDR